MSCCIEAEISVEEHLKILKHGVKNFADYQIKREEYILSNLLELKKKIEEGSLEDFRRNGN